MTALGFLSRSGIRDTAKYTNTADVEAFLVKGKPAYLGGMLSMANHRLYGFWGTLEDALRTGNPQNESKTGDAPLFEAIYSKHETLVDFLKAMSSIQMGNFLTLAEKFDFTPYKKVCDMGGANGSLSIVLAVKYPHLKCISFDLPPVEPVANEHTHAMNMSGRVKTMSGDFFKDQFPAADIITMGNVLHDWGAEDKLFLIRKAYNALPKGGVFIAIENLIDDDRRQNAFGLMMSLNMVIETDDGSRVKNAL